MSNDLLDQLAQSYVNAIVTGQREPNYLNVPYYLRPPAEALNQNALTNGAISNASWLDFNPIAKSALDTFMEASGAAPSARLVDRLVKLQSPVLRPQSAYEWADWGAGAAADTIQTGLAGADLAALAPHIGRRAANSLMNELGQVDVWHGSPHRFDRVSHEKIGTGEGAQAFGWGTYYTSEKDIADYYRTKNSGLLFPPKTYQFEYNGVNYSREGGKYAKGSGEIISKEEYGKAYSAAQEKYYEDLKNQGVTYRAQLFPGKDPSEYTFLDWYEPVPQGAIKKVENQLIGEKLKSKDFKIDFSEAEETFGDETTGDTFYRSISKLLGSEREASLFLKRAGIDGIRYPTETLSGKGPKGGGAYNYVVFDENDVRLVQRESGGVVEDLLKNQQ